MTWKVGNNDPEYELFLHNLRAHNKSYVLETEIDGMPHLIKYEPEVETKDEQRACPKADPVDVEAALVVKNEAAQTTLNYTVGNPYQARLVDRKVFERDEVDDDDLIEIDRDHFYQNKKDVVCANVGQELIKRDVKKEINPCLEIEGAMQGQIRTLKCANCSITFKMIDGKHLSEEDDLQILDIAVFEEKGITCPFVSAKKFHMSMVDDELPRIRDIASEEFRADVLRFLIEPFDKKEYTWYRKQIKNGSYLDHHSDLKRKLKKYRYRKKKCMIILRGFFYWLQNLTREGAFQPWTDEECLAVEPASTSS